MPRSAPRLASTPIRRRTPRFSRMKTAAFAVRCAPNVAQPTRSRWSGSPRAHCGGLHDDHADREQSDWFAARSGAGAAARFPGAGLAMGGGLGAVVCYVWHAAIAERRCAVVAVEKISGDATGIVGARPGFRATG